MNGRRGEGGMPPCRRISAPLRAPGASSLRKAFCGPLFLLLLLALLLSGCEQAPVPPYRAAAPRKPCHPSVALPKPSRVIVRRVAYLGGPRTIYHEVGPGESVLQISRMYGVSPQSIDSANSLRRGERLLMGQKLVIHGVRTIRYVINLYRDRPWSYIIVHHTATDDGNATTIQRAHLERGFWNGLGYDFVIDNGTMGEGDGQIQMSPRWLRQEDGAHCQADDMNQRGIGIALVGNFDIERPSRYQLQSLAYLVFILRRYYDIPPSHVMGHRQVPGARTDCPGKLFPMNYLRWAACR